MRERKSFKDMKVDGIVILKILGIIILKIIFKKWDQFMGWIDLSQYWYRWLVVVTALINLWVS